MSIVIPVLNEENQITDILDTARSFLERRGGDWEIILVDNASTDRTRERAEPFLDGNRVRYLCNDVNRGKGYSIRRGMLEASGDLRLMCDADCSPSLSSLPRLEKAQEPFANLIPRHFVLWALFHTYSVYPITDRVHHPTQSWENEDIHHHDPRKSRRTPAHPRNNDRAYC